MTPAERYFRSIESDRTAWRDEMPPRCMACNHKFGWLGMAFLRPEIHEILSRAQAPNAWGFRANYLVVCQLCHPEVQNMPHASQLAIKRRRDPKHFDLREWLRRRNPNAMEYVTDEDVRRAS